jgi:endonuclease/exonuclease/phosphatase family metal-dependent hydrolase
MDYSNINADTARRLKLLNKRIKEANIPSSSLDESLNIATWNIRDFGKSKRSDTAILFIAQILYQFDLVAITEVRDNLTDFKRVLERLGSSWKFVISDWQDDRGGNWERTAIIYDERMVNFTGLAAEAQPDRNKMGDNYYSKTTWWRSPYFASFQAGSFDFILMAMHARWGTTGGRRDELESFGDWIKQRWDDKSDKVFDDDLILVGDFNIPAIGDKFYKALTDKSKLRMPASLAGIKDTAASPGNKRYDHILHRSCDDFPISFADRGGVIDFARDHLMKDLFPDVKESKLTWQLSDHFPLWVQVHTDNDEQRLDRIIKS